MHNHEMSNSKASNFKGAMTRLFKELKGYKIIIVIAILLAIFSSILAIISPNKLSDLTDKISEGLIINTDNAKKISNNIESSFKKMDTKLLDILELDISEQSIYKIMSNQNITLEEKDEFQRIIQNNEYNKVLFLSPNILKHMINDSTYNGIKISKNEKLDFIKNINKIKENKYTIPKSIQTALIDDIKIDGILITNKDQAKFISLLDNSNTKNVKKVYKKLDKAPKSVQRVLKPTMDKKAIKKIALFLIIVYVSSSMFNFIEMIMMTIVSNNFAKTLRSRISLKINKIPLYYFDSHPIGDTLSRITNDVDTIAQSLNQSLASLVSNLVLFLGCAIMMFVTNVYMALTAIISSFLGFMFMGLILKNSQKYFKQRQKYLGSLNGHIEEIYSGLNVVKVYNGIDEVNEKFDKLNKKVYNANRKSQFLSGLMMPMMAFIGNFGYVAVCIVGALLTMNDYISFGVIVAFMAYVRIFTSPLSQIAQAFTMLQSTAAASERVFEFIDQKEMPKENKNFVTLNKEDVKGKVEFKNISFTYDGNKSPTIKDFSAVAHPGQKIAIVGPTGAGKTTMVNLLMKFYQINDGDILIDDVSIKNITRENVHDLFTMVLQDTWLFEGTIEENIKFNRESTSLKKVEKVCTTIGLDHYIKTLPKGYKSVIKSNDNVSAGERQLLTIARGMIEDAPFLILDEATSNVDTRTERLVQSAMDKLMENRTSFIIAHRLSTIKNADLILVMKEGNIVEKGNHESLMKKRGFYYELYNSQFEI